MRVQAKNQKRPKYFSNGSKSGNVLAKSKKLAINLPEEDEIDTLTQPNLLNLFLKLGKNSPSNIRSSPKYQKSPTFSSTPKAKTIYKKSSTVKSKSASGTPKNVTRKSSKITPKTSRKSLRPSKKQTLLPSYPIAKDLRRTSKQIVKQSKTPTSQFKQDRSPKRPSSTTNKRKQNQLNKFITKVATPDAFKRPRDVQLSEEEIKIRSDIIYRDHLFQTFNSLRFIRQLPVVDKSELTDLMVDLKKKPGYEGKKTLVLDLDETLVHCCDENDTEDADVIVPVTFPTGETVLAGINIRPFARECLEFANKHFEVIIFTASHQCYADVVLDYLDPKRNLIHYRLYRDSCVMVQGVCIKDLRILKGRDLKDVIIVDNATHSFGFQLDNGIPIISWHDDYFDRELFNLMDYLRVLAEVEDVREVNRNTFHMDTFYDDYISEFLGGEDLSTNFGDDNYGNDK